MLSFRLTMVVLLWSGVFVANAADPARAQCPPTGAQCPLVRLLPCDLKPGDSLRVYAAQGNRIIAGAPGADDVSPGNADCNSGATYVFRRDGTAWVQEARLTAPNPTCGKFFGSPAAIGGNRLIVGAVPASSPGRAYVFQRDDGGTPGDPADDVWNLDLGGELSSPNPTTERWFGEISIDGDVAIVGAAEPEPLDCSDVAAAYIYRRGPAG